MIDQSQDPELSLDATLTTTTHLYTKVCPSVGRLVGRSVGPSVGPSVGDAFVRNKENQYFEQIIAKEGILDKSHVITSPYYHFIIMRTHRWPYGPC